MLRLRCNIADVVLGYDDCTGYLRDTCFLGSTVGRNANRLQQVPESVIAGMLERIIPPEGHEAQMVEWHCV